MNKIKPHPCSGCIIDPVCRTMCEKFINFFNDNMGNSDDMFLYFNRKEIYKSEKRVERFVNYLCSDKLKNSRKIK